MESDFIPYEAVLELPRGPVLVLAPHPDDEVIGCGGAILRHRRQGDAVSVLLATDGGAAVQHRDPAARAAYATLRRSESRAAAAVLGYEELLCWDAADRALASWPQLDERLRVLLAERGPAAVYAPSVYEVHPDHAALAQALCRLAPAMDASVQVLFYEVGWPAPVNLLLDITADVARKRQALHCFASQLALQDYARHMEALNVYRTYTLPAQVQAAEGFLSLSAGELAAEPMRCFGRSRLTERARHLQRVS